MAFHSREDGIFHAGVFHWYTEYPSMLCMEKAS
jgi:hypothetical protein